MKLVKFGGPLGDVYDSVSRQVLHPTLTGEAMLPPDYPDDLLPGASACLRKHTTNVLIQAFSEGRGYPMGGDGPPWKAELDTAGAAASAELRAAIRFGSFEVSFSEEDRPKVAAARRQAAMARIAPPGQAQGQVAPAAPAAVGGTLPAGMSPPLVSPPAAVPVVSPVAPSPPAASSKLPLLLGGGVVLLAIVSGVAWHFTHSRSAPPAHEHEHGKGKH
jgi:hypothetical protein